MKIERITRPLLLAGLLIGLTAFGQANKPTATISTINGLVARIPVTVPGDEVVSVLGYTAEGDWGAPRVAKYVSASVAATNLGCVFMPVTAVGRWVFQDCESGDVDIRWFGGTNTSASITAGLTKLLSRPTTINGANRSIYLADGVAPTAAAGTLTLYATNSLGHSVGLAHPGGSNELVATRSPTTGQIDTNQLPGFLSGLSVGNGQGVLTNLALPVTYFWQNTNQVSALASNITIPTGARLMHVECIGAGGAGGSGRRGAAGSVRSGGGGGGGGAYAFRFVPVSTLWSTTIRITIPAVAVGGAGATTDDTDGTNGATASASTIVYVGTTSTSSNYICRAALGLAGVGGDSDGSAGGAATASGDALGNPGNASSATGAFVSAIIGSGKGGRGGGAGGGITTGDVPSAGSPGSVGGVHSAFATASGPINGGAVPTYAALTTVTHPSYLYGASGFPGPSGSGGSTNIASANGGDGEFPGVGGGGSGATLNGYTPGRGGNGGPGAVWITFY